MEKKGTTVLLTVIGIATLLVAVVGATFAYFTAQVAGNNTETDVTITAAQLGTITYKDGTLIDLCGTKEGEACVIYPGALETSTFTIENAANTNVDVDYEVYLNVTENTFPISTLDTNAEDGEDTNVQYQICAGSTCGTDESAWINIKKADTKIPVKESTLVAADGTDATVDSWTIAVRLNETGAPQNDDQNQTFKAYLSVEAASTYTTIDTATDTIGEYTAD